jgi:hypothetical protein
MFRREIIVTFLRDKGVSEKEILLVKGRMEKHNHDSSGLLSTVCLTDVFLNPERQAAFISPTIPRGVSPGMQGVAVASVPSRGYN